MNSDASFSDQISESSASFLHNTNDFSDRNKDLNGALLNRENLENIINDLRSLKQEQDHVISQIDDNTINNFCNVLKADLNIDIITDSFVREQIKLDSKTHNLVLFDCGYELEDIVSAAVNLEHIDLDEWEAINILFLKLQTFYHLRFEIFTEIEQQIEGLDVDYVYGTIMKKGEAVFQWDILVSNGGSLVQNKLSTPIVEKRSLLKDIVCKKGIYVGIREFIQ